MPIATVELLVDKKYLVIGFRPKWELPEVYRDEHGRPGLRRSRPALPAGLYDFSPKDQCVQTPTLVTLQLPRDDEGKVDVLNMMVAADWLTDQGWEVEPIGWCKDVFDRVKGTVPA